MVDRIEEPILYKDFVERYLQDNKPCIFSSDLITSRWKCSNLWIRNNKLDTAYMEKHFGHLTAPVMDCNKQYFSSHEKMDMKVFEFLTFWNNRDSRLLYLKDWHLQKQTDVVFYDVPLYFTSDWLNEYFDSENEDDYRFVYIGVKGSWTSFHADVFHSYSWSANICGLKKWIFFPPGEEEKLKDQFGNLPFNISFLPLNEMDITYFTVFQKSGEVIFVPSGWHHQVYNLEDTVSINHNWINAFSIQYVWKHLKSSLESVRKEISDCCDMEGFHEQCQLILLSFAGMDYKGFVKMLSYLATKRLEIFGNISDTDDRLNEIFISSQPGVLTNNEGLSKYNQLVTDLKAIKETLLFIAEDTDLKEAMSKSKLKELKALLSKIAAFLTVK